MNDLFDLPPDGKIQPDEAAVAGSETLSQDAVFVDNIDVPADSSAEFVEFPGEISRNQENFEEEADRSEQLEHENEQKAEIASHFNRYEFEKKEIDLIKRPDVAINPASFGATLKALREASHLSIGTISEQTRISSEYLKALENEDFKNLPPPVYSLAYIKRLALIYHLTEEEIEIISKPIKSQIEFDLPEEISKVVVNYEQSEENEDKVKHIFAALVVLLILGGAAIVFGLFMLFGNEKGKEPRLITPSEIRFNDDKLLELQAPPLLNATELAMPQK